MSGQGIDRHLFSLYIVCRGQGHVSTLVLYYFIEPSSSLAAT